MYTYDTYIKRMKVDKFGVRERGEDGYTTRVYRRRRPPVCQPASLEAVGMRRRAGFAHLFHQGLVQLWKMMPPFSLPNSEV